MTEVRPTWASQVKLVLTAAESQRQERAQQADTLTQTGWSQRDIAKRLGCHPKTVSRYLRCSGYECGEIVPKDLSVRVHVSRSVSGASRWIAT